MELIYVILHILLIIILLVLLLLILLLFLPIQYSLQGQLKEDYHLVFRVGCGFLYQVTTNIIRGNRLLAFRLMGIRLPVKDSPASQESRKTKKKYRSHSRPSRRELRSVLNRELFQEALSLLSRSYLHIKPSRVYLQGCFGFEEPHFTAWMLPLIGLVNGWDSAVEINLLPVWDEACLNIDLEVQGRIIPVLLLLFLLQLMISRPARRIIKDKWKSKNVKKSLRMQPNEQLAGK